MEPNRNSELGCNAWEAQWPISRIEALATLIGMASTLSAPSLIHALLEREAGFD